jgi:hypothetical protein
MFTLIEEKNDFLRSVNARTINPIKVSSVNNCGLFESFLLLLGTMLGLLATSCKTLATPLVIHEGMCERNVVTKRWNIA